MYTYQDLQNLGEREDLRKDFVFSLIKEHKGTKDYRTARDAYEYFCHKNVTINEYQKLLYNVKARPFQTTTLRISKWRAGTFTGS